MVAAELTTPASRVLTLFADLLEYPSSGLAQTARECARIIAHESPEAATRLEEFAAFVERTPRNTLEEVFTATFDLNASRHPYVGYHMFGEAYKRSVLLLELKERFRAHGFDSGSELPDHIAVLLRFMALCPDEELITELVREAILPTLEPMMVAPEAEPVGPDEEAPVPFDIGDDYSRVLRALQLILVERYGPPAELEVIPLPDESRLVS